MLTPVSPDNSTIVRSTRAVSAHAAPLNPATGGTAMQGDDYTDARNAVIVALGLWAGAVLLGTQADVFARLPVEVFAALVAFAVAFAIAAVTLDMRLRGWLERCDAAMAWITLAGIDLLVVAAGQVFEAGRAGGDTITPWAPILLFAMPVTGALAVSGIRGLRGARAAGLNRPASKAPVRHPAAT